MSVIHEYLMSLHEPEKTLIAHMYDIVRHMAPTATEELSYAMPAFKYKGKGLAAIMANKNFLSFYPFCAVEGLGVDTSGYEQTSGSIHFSVHKPIPDDLLSRIIAARINQIDDGGQQSGASRQPYRTT